MSDDTAYWHGKYVRAEARIGFIGDALEEMEQLYNKAASQMSALTAALQQISDMGPMSVDDQRWRIAREALTSASPASQLPVGS